MSLKSYSVTIDVPGGRSWGYAFEGNLEAASDAFAEAAQGTHPVGTEVRLWEQYGETGTAGVSHTVLDLAIHTRTVRK